MSIIRIAELVLGWDCRNGCNDERHKAAGWKGNHGQHNDEWIYAVRVKEDGFGEAAVALVINSREATTRGDKAFYAKEGSPEAAGLSLHVPWRLTEDHVKEQQKGERCRWIEAGFCFGKVRYDTAKTFFAAFGQPKFEQTEEFWASLETHALRWVPESRLDAAEFLVQPCKSCNATGIVPKGTPAADVAPASVYLNCRHGKHEACPGSVPAQRCACPCHGEEPTVPFTEARRAAAISEPLTGGNVPLPDKTTPEQLAQHVESMACSFLGWPGNKCSDAEMVFKVALGALRRQDELSTKNVLDALRHHACMTGDCPHGVIQECWEAIVHFIQEKP